jgi:hypothetical protein
MSVTIKLIKVKRHKRHSHSFSSHFCNTVLRYLSAAKSALAPNFVTLGSFRYSYHITFGPRLHTDIFILFRRVIRKFLHSSRNQRFRRVALYLLHEQWREALIILR